VHYTLDKGNAEKSDYDEITNTLLSPAGGIGEFPSENFHHEFPSWISIIDFLPRISVMDFLSRISIMKFLS